MISEYPATYSDKRGEETTAIMNDAQNLTMTIRGVKFEGSSFDLFEPATPSDRHLLEQFSLQLNCLCACQIACQIPLPVVVEDRIVDAILGVHLELGEPVSNGSLNREFLSLTLDLDGKIYGSSGESGWFEGELLALQRLVPEGAYLRACINCAFSDYSPYGHGLFGCMACFRNSKEKYLNVRSKADLFRVWDENAGTVQETFVCPEFKRRVPGTGYRG